MTIDKLAPLPTSRENFKRNCVKFVTEKSGCYVLTTFGNLVLYLGQAVNIRSRMIDHLDTPEKTAETQFGRAVFFYWLEYEDIGKLERTWLNIHVEHEGRYPILNKVYSPLSI